MKHYKRMGQQNGSRITVKYFLFIHSKRRQQMSMIFSTLKKDSDNTRKTNKNQYIYIYKIEIKRYAIYNIIILKTDVELNHLKDSSNKNRNQMKVRNLILRILNKTYTISERG